VSRQQTGDLRWPGTQAVYLPCTGNGSPTCAQLAARKPLAELAGDASEIYLCAFSAGGQVVKRWLPDDRVRGVYLADATYTRWESKGRPFADPSLVQWLLKAATDPTHRAVFTSSSSPNKSLPNGSQTLEALALAVETAGGAWNHQPAAPRRFGDVELPEVRSWSYGGAFLLDLGRSVPHEQHATKIAPLLFSRLFIPVQSPAEASATSPPRVAAPHATQAWVPTAIAVTAALFGVGVAVTALTRRRPPPQHQTKTREIR
jgi:hypothetical protein